MHYFARKKLFALALHPRLYALAHALGEGAAEGAVTAEAALLGQLLDAYILTSSNALLIETDKVVDAQVININIVGDA